MKPVPENFSRSEFMQITFFDALTIENFFIIQIRAEEEL